ncbi:MAG: glycoside hydrolase [Chromatiales bacterium]|nr:glycoside hydrolase [Chromatiales bacterium]
MSAKDDRLKVVLLWHMHQPEYRAGSDGEYRLPWTYLHGIKDYVDMAAHIEMVPEARAVVNFAPTLLEQLDDYARQTRDYLACGASPRDPLLAALVQGVLPQETELRESLIRACLRANENRLIQRFPPFARLAAIARRALEDIPSLIYLSDQFLADILVWYHLAWMGETVRLKDRRIIALVDKAQGYTLYDRRILMEVIADLLGGVIGRYRRLWEKGKVELSFTPYAHPIMPLMLDLNSARDAMPNVPLPKAKAYPGGEERVRWHIEKGLEVFEKHFGHRPQGCWPSEGSVSDETLKILHEYKVHWVATGEQVLHNSLAKAGMPDDRAGQCQHRAYRVGDKAGPCCFFRDDGLSDLVGFQYANWHADDAVANLLHNLENIANACRDNHNAVCTIALDGENAWETYPDNGYHFLKALYTGLSKHPRLRLSTLSECARSPMKLPGLMAGSWVYGTFSTWIGDKDKNRGWDMLVDAKRAFDNALAIGRLSETRVRKAERQMAVCEGSDWFWWFGDYNPGETVAAFDNLYRQQLLLLYELIGEDAPEYLAHSFSRGGGAGQPMGGVMRRNV